MVLEIQKNCGWKKVYINILDKEYNLIQKKELKFKQKISTVQFDLESDYFFFLSNDKGYETERIIVSENLEIISLKYNHKKRKYYFYLV